MTKRSFEGKRVLLTGATSGIGWYVADMLVRKGAKLVVTGRREERLDQLRLSFGNPKNNLVAVPGDIADAHLRSTLIDTTLSRFGGIDILINNAGVGAIGKFEEASPERLQRIFDVDFFAAAELTRIALPHLKKGNAPAVCLVNSVLGHRAVPHKSEYCAAKFALRGWAESLRVELRPEGIDVINVSPSTTRSEFFDSLIDTAREVRNRSLGLQSAESVARGVIRALRGRKRDLILSPGGRALVWLGNLAPRLADNLLLRFAT